MDLFQVRRMRLENITPNPRYLLHRDNFAVFLAMSFLEITIQKLIMETGMFFRARKMQLPAFDSCVQ